MESVNNNPILVIQTITYNHARYIRQALEGLVMQRTNFSFVAIVHDDASTDGTADIIREFESLYPDIIKPIYETENQYSKHDGSLGRIMREATDAYSPKYIAMCEGDDYWTDPLKLQKQVDFLESHLDYSMCFHNAVIHYEDGNQEDRLFSDIETRQYFEKELTSGWLGATASYVFRRSVLLSRYFTEFVNSTKFIVGDYPLLLSCIRSGKIFAISDCMSVYRINPGGWTQRKHSAYKFIEMEREVDRIFGGIAGESAKINASKYSREALSLLFKGNLHESFKIWNSALKFAPWLTIKANVKFAFRLCRSKFGRL